jgi:hypothetical protein
MTAPAASKDNTQLFGILGIVLSWCFIGGLVFSVLSIVQANRFGKPKTLGIIGLVLTIVFQVIWYVAFYS